MKEVIEAIRKEDPNFKGAVLFSEKNGSLTATPIFPADITVDKLITQLRSWSDAIAWIARDMEVNMNLHRTNRKN